MSSQETIAARVKNVFCATLKISPDRYREDLEIGDIVEWDSLGQVNLLQAAEAEFGIALDVQDALDVQSVGDLLSTVQRYVDQIVST